MELVDWAFVSAKAAINTSTPCMRVWRVSDGRHCACFCWLTHDAPSHLAGKAWHPQIGSSPVRFKSLWRQCVHLEQVCRPQRLRAPRAPLPMFAHSGTRSWRHSCTSRPRSWPLPGQTAQNFEGGKKPAITLFQCAQTSRCFSIFCLKLAPVVLADRNFFGDDFFLFPQLFSPAAWGQ